MPVSCEYVVKRLFMLILVVLGVLVLTFMITRVIPARPELLWAGPRATLEQIERARRELRLDQPIHIQLAYFLWEFLSGEWVRSWISWSNRQPVIVGVLSALPATLELVLTAFALAIAIGIPLGLYAALKFGGPVDNAVRVIAILGASAPAFWVALVLQLVFGIWLGLLPAGKRVEEALVMATGFKPITGFYLLDSLIQGNAAVFCDALRRIVLPAVTISLYPMSLTIRMVRSLAIEVLNENHVRFLRANGMPTWTLLRKYVLKGVIAPVIASLGLSFGYTLVGAFMVEVVFTWPGLGSYTWSALVNFDYPAVIGSIMFVAILYTIINMGVDLIHAWLDPRVRL